MAKKKKKKIYGYDEANANSRFAPGGSAVAEWEESQRNAFTKGHTAEGFDTEKRWNTDVDKDNYSPIKTNTYRTYMAGKLAAEKAKNPDSKIHITASDLSDYNKARAKLYNINPAANLKTKSEFTSQYKSSVDQKYRLSDMVNLAQNLDLGETKIQVRHSYNDLNAVKDLANTRQDAESLLKQVNEYRKKYGDSKELKVIEDRAKGITDYINKNAKGGSAVSNKVFEQSTAPLGASVYDKFTQTKQDIEDKYAITNELNLREKYGSLNYDEVKQTKAQSPAEKQWLEDRRWAIGTPEQLKNDYAKANEEKLKLQEERDLLTQEENEKKIDLDSRNKEQQKADNSKRIKQIDNRLRELSKFTQRYRKEVEIPEEMAVFNSKELPGLPNKVDSKEIADIIATQSKYDDDQREYLKEELLSRDDAVDTYKHIEEKLKDYKGKEYSYDDFYINGTKEADRDNFTRYRSLQYELAKQIAPDLVDKIANDVYEQEDTDIKDKYKKELSQFGKRLGSDIYEVAKRQGEGYLAELEEAQAYERGEEAPITSIGEGAVSRNIGGLSTFFNNIGKNFEFNTDESKLDPVDYNAYGLRRLKVGQAQQEGGLSTIDNENLKKIYQAVNSGVDMGLATIEAAPLFAIPGVGKKLGVDAITFIMGTQAGASAMLEAHEQGMSDREALQYGLVSGINETAGEKLSIDTIFNAMGGKAKTLKNFLGALGKSFLAEGSEEVVTNLLNRTYDDMVNGNNSLYNRKIKEFMEQGLTKNQAREKADKDFFKQLGDEFTVGGLAGLMFGGGVGGVSNVTNAISNAKTSREVGSIINDSLDEGSLTDEDIKYMANVGTNSSVPEINEKAKKIKSKLEKGEPISDMEIGSLSKDLIVANEGIDLETQEFANDPLAVGYNKQGQHIYIDNVKSGDVSFIDAQGNKVNSNEVELVDLPQTQLMEYGLDNDYSKTNIENMIKGFDSANTDDIGVYEDNYNLFFNIGKDSQIKGFEDALSKAPELKSGINIIGSDAAGKAFSQGREYISQLKEPGLTSVPTGTFTNDTGKSGAIYDFAKGFANWTGADVIATETPEKYIDSNVKSSNIRGVFLGKKGQIIINTKYDSVIRVLNHEAGHLTSSFAQDEADVVAKKCMDFARDSLGIKGVDNAIKNIQLEYESSGQKISYTQAQDEFIKNIIGTAMASEDGIKALADNIYNDDTISENQKKSIIDKLIDWIKDLIDKLVKISESGGTYEGTEFVNEDTEQRKEIIDAQIKALKQTRDILEQTRELFNDTESQESGSISDEEQYSFAGVKSETADISMLDKAQQLEEEGKSKEAILKDTGWFKGLDGMWRYEIDDRNVKIKDTTILWSEATLKDIIEAKELFKAYPFLKNINFDVIGSLSNSLGQYDDSSNTISLNSDYFENSYVNKRRQEIYNSQEYKKHSNILNKIYEDNADKIKDAQKEVIKANELDASKDENIKKMLKAVDTYNKLKNERDEKVDKEKARFNDSEIGQELLELSNDMSVDSIISYKADEVKKVILHEMQHAIQRAESFATGASPGYWSNVNEYLKGMTKYDEELFNSLDKKRLDIVKKIKNEFNLKQDIKQLERVLSVIRSNQKGYEYSLNMKSNIYDKYDKEKYSKGVEDTLKSYKIPRKAIYKYMDSFNAISDEMVSIRDNALDRAEKDPFRLYKKTAGEIESRDVESRSELTAKERRENYPESAKPQEVYFAGKETLNKSAKYSLAQDSEGRELSVEQKEYFKDSKVRDEEGRLLVVHHGSRSDFTIFDISKGSRSNSLAGVGFWFTANKQGAEDFGNSMWGGEREDAAVYSGYIDIKNPKIYEEVDNTQTLKDIDKKIDDIDEKLRENGKNLSDIDNPSRYKYISKGNWKYEIARNYGVKEEDYDKITKAIETLIDLQEQKEDLYAQREDAKLTDAYDYFQKDVLETVGLGANRIGYDIYIYTNKKYTAEDARRLYREKLEKEGYDGIIIKNTDYDFETFGGRNDQYVVFNSNQFKNIDNKQPTTNEDIRYSVEEEAADTDDIKQDTIDKVQRDALNQLSDAMLELTDKKLPDYNLLKITHKIKDIYNIDLTNRTIKEQLDKVNNAIIKNNGEVNNPEVLNVASDVMRSLLRYSNGMIIEENRDILDEIKNTKIKLSDKQKNQITDYGHWFRSNLGKISVRRDGIDLDSIWQEWVEKYPQYFNSDVNEGDQPYTLISIIDTLRNGVEFSTRDQDIKNYATDLLFNFAEQFEIKNNSLTNAYKKLSRLINNDIEARITEAIDEINEYKDIEMAEMQYRSRKARQELEEKKKTTAIRKRNKKMLQKLKRAFTYPTIKNRVPEVLKNTLGNFLNAVDPEEMDRLDYYDKRIKKLQDRMAMTTGEEYKQVEKELQAVIDRRNNLETAFLDFSNAYKSSKQALEQQGEFSEPLMDSLQNIRAMLGFSDTRDTVREKVKQGTAGLVSRSIMDFNLEEQQELYKCLKMIQVEINNYNNIIDNSIIGKDGKAHHISELVVEADKEVKVRESDKKFFGNILNAKTDFVTKNLRPDVVFNKIGGYHKNNIWLQAVETFKEGTRESMRVQQRAYNELADILDSKEAREIQKYDDKHLYKTGLYNDKGNEIRLPKGMIIMLKMHLMNKRNRAHLIGGGLTIPNFERYYKGKGGLDSKQQIFKGIDKEVRQIDKDIAIELNKEAPDFEQIQEWDKQISKLVKDEEAVVKRLEQALDKVLTEWDYEYINTHFKVFDGIMKEELNNVTQKRFGVDLAQEDKYVRLISDKDYFNKLTEGGYGIEKDMVNTGFMQQRTGARNPIILEDCLNSDIDQIRKSADYVGYLIPQHNFNRLIRYTAVKKDANGNNVRGKDGKLEYVNLTKTLRRKYPGALKYIDDLKMDLFGGKPSVDYGFLSTIQSGVAIQGLVNNPRVELMQLASYPFAGVELGFKPIVKALVKGGRKGRIISRANRELIDSKTPLLWYRESQNGAMSEIAQARNNKTGVGKLYSRIVNTKAGALMFGRIEKMDLAAVGRTWYACEYKVRQDKSIKVGSDEYWEKVVDLFNKSTEKTQPNYVPITRNYYQRSTNPIFRFLEMFKTVLNQMNNEVYDAQGTYKAMKEDYNNGKEFGTTKKDVQEAFHKRNRAVVAYVISHSLVMAIRIAVTVTLLHKGWKDLQDEDERVDEGRISKYITDTLFTDVLSGFLLGSELADSITALTDKLVGYNDKFKPDWTLGPLGIVADLLDNIKNADELIDPDKRAKRIKDIAMNLSSILGIPYRNTENFAKGIYGLIEDIVDDASLNYSNDINENKTFRKYILGDLSKEQAQEQMAFDDNNKQKFNSAAKSLFQQGKVSKEDLIKKMKESGMYESKTRKQPTNSYILGKLEWWNIENEYKDEFVSTLTDKGAQTADSRKVITKIANMPYSNAFWKNPDSESSKSSYEKLLNKVKRWKKSN